MIELDDGAYSALHTEKGYTMDITSNKETGKALVKLIENNVKDTQSVIARSMPDKLIVTQKQYNDLIGQPELMDMSGTGQEFWLYKTKLNIMEVQIKT